MESADQGYVLPGDFRWVREGILWQMASSLLYGVILVCGRVFLSANLRWRVENRHVLETGEPGGYMLYCNHTQPVGDAFAPELAVFPKRAYIVASPANLGIPFLGKLLPTIGALPVPSTLAGLKELRGAIARRLGEGAAVVVYPEAHVWPFYTGIRPFPATSFAFAVENHVPAYCMTTTYQSPGRGGRPRAVAYLDGPFWPREGVSKKAARERLRDEVHDAMVRRARLSNCEHIRYERMEGADEHPVLR